MKTTGAGEQVLPIRFSSKQGLAGKEARPQPSAPHFDEVLSGLSSGATRRSAVGAADDASSEAGAAPDESGALASLLIAPLHLMPAAKTPHAGAAQRPPAERERIHAAVSGATTSAPPPRSAREAPVKAVPGALPRHGAQGANGDSRQPQAARPADFAATVTDRAVPAMGTIVESQPQQPLALPTAPIRDPRRASVAATRQAHAPDSVAERGEGGSDDVSVLEQETHFRPVGSTRGPAPGETMQDAPRRPAEQVRPTHAGQASPDRMRSDAVNRVEAQGKPATPATPAPLQVGAAILQDIAEAEAEPPAVAASPSAGAPASDAREPLRLLKVALEPEELGRVTVRMRLTGRTLDLKVTAERAETASLLERDRHLLGKILRESGYNADDIAIAAQGASAAATAPAARSPDAPPAGQVAQQFPSSGWSDGERKPPSPGNGRGDRPPQEMHGDEADRDPRRGDALYV